MKTKKKGQFHTQDIERQYDAIKDLQLVMIKKLNLMQMLKIYLDIGVHICEA